ncbi:hypothetical protein [Hyphomicrobium sp.]|uniref:hypothetical protein n=1 Tax=Hyphomicrobium sp. TaxID=82 RepID=UPI0025BDF8BC|nr:hypothetical protein [Hyphomicrobium sp.]MCC7250368.1 hypothetical protein [Hyphomicrobium sp.]
MKLGSVLGGRWGRGVVWAAAGVVLGLGALAWRAEADEDKPANLSCAFAEGASWTYETGAFQSKPPNPLSFAIADIDLERQTATLRATPGAEAGKLSVVRAINANHYLEVVNEGFLNLTTVYDKDEKAGKHPAVHSRHFGLLGSPVFAQYTGFCTDE